MLFNHGSYRQTARSSINRIHTEPDRLQPLVIIKDVAPKLGPSTLVKGTDFKGLYTASSKITSNTPFNNYLKPHFSVKDQTINPYTIQKALKDFDQIVHKVNSINSLNDLAKHLTELPKKEEERKAEEEEKKSQELSTNTNTDISSPNVNPLFKQMYDDNITNPNMYAKLWLSKNRMIKIAAHYNLPYNPPKNKSLISPEAIKVKKDIIDKIISKNVSKRDFINFIMGIK